MGTQATQAVSALPETAQVREWRPLTRIAFRFCFVYFGLYCLLTQIIVSFLLPTTDRPDPSTLWPIRQIVTWTAVHLFRVTKPLVYFSGSGDKTFDWVLMFCMLVVSVAVTVVWSVVDRKRANYVTLNKWFRLFIRFALAGQMFGYGLAKLVPLQMPFPSLTRLVEPYGNFSPMGVLWYSIGASPSYEMFVGAAETLGGLLLILPRTATLGALVCLADMTEVFMLNMTYDVPVKLLSFHLILLSVLLLAPELQRLGDVFFLDRPSPASSQPALFTKPLRNRVALVLQIAFGAWLLGINVYGSTIAWHKYGAGAPKSALYGIWDITQLTVDGQSRPPLLTEKDQLRRAIFEFPQVVAFQRMDDSFVRYGAAINSGEKTVALTKFDDKSWKANFTFQQPEASQLVLDGEMDHHKLHMQLQLVDRNKFLLVSRGFHWVQEYPYNR